MSMKTAILNSALPYITQGVGNGFKLSISHFSLAWVSETERTNNPVSAQMTEMVQQSPLDGVIKGDYIYNIWQSPFPYEKYSGQYPAPIKTAVELENGFGNYYQYEYDECLGRNVLKPNQITTYANLPQQYKDFFNNSTQPDHSYLGYIEGSASSSQLNVENIPPQLRYSSSGPTLQGVGEYTKFFPIKAFRPITQTNSNNSTIMNYSLNLPPISVNYSNQADFFGKSIGNFKFNRIGLYMTVVSERSDSSNTQDPKDFYEPMASMESIFSETETYPILFAVIDLGVNAAGCSGNDVSFDVYKTRDDKGFAGWEFDAQLTLSSEILEANQEFYTLYTDAIRDEATKYYQAQILNNASMSETIMQLQMMVLQLANRIEEFTGSNPFTSNKTTGYDVESSLESDLESVIGSSSVNRKFLFDAAGFRGVESQGSQYVNDTNYLFTFKSSSLNNSLNDGDFIKLTIYNLDGRIYDINGEPFPMWRGSILFANLNESNGIKTKIYEINSDLIKNIAYAKVTLLFSYSQNGLWVLETVSIIDESRLIA